MRKQKNKQSKGISLLKTKLNPESIYFYMRLCVAVLFGAFLLYDRSFINLLINARTDSSYFLPFFFLYIIFLIPCIYVLYKEFNSHSVKLCVILFFIAFLPRLFFLFYIDYIPFSDFLRYFTFGRNVLAGEVVHYCGFPIFGLMGIQNAVIMSVFSTHLIGFQLAHILFGCISCILLYVIFKDWDKRVAVISGFLLAIYPTAIFASVVTGNRNSALVFMLFSILFLQKALSYLEHAKLRYSLMHIFVSTCFLMVSHFFHNSGVIVLISFGLFLVFYSYKTLSLVKRAAILFSVPLVVFVALPPILISLTYEYGIIDCRHRKSILDVVASGTDYPHGTGWHAYLKPSYIESRLLRNQEELFPDIQELFPFFHRGQVHLVEIDGVIVPIWYLEDDVQRRVFSEIITLNLREMGLSGTLRLFRNKMDYIWIGEATDYIWIAWGGYLRRLDSWEREGSLTVELYERRDLLRARIIPGMSNLDLVFTQWIYILSIIGILLRRKIDVKSPYNIFTIILGGWVAFTLIVVAVTRYRFNAMIFFMVFAAIGIVCLYDFWKSYDSKIIKKLRSWIGAR